MRKLKRLFLVILLLLILSGCNKNTVIKEDKVNDNDIFILEKEDKSKEFVYLSNYKEIMLNDGDTYLLQNIVVNIKSEDVLNVNLELSSFVKKSYKDMVIENNILKQGTIIDYAYSETDKYISIRQNYFLYIDGIIGEVKTNVYVISKETGKVLNNTDILNYFGFTEEKVYEKMEATIDSDDVLYTLMNIKNNGYYLYVNSEEKMVAIYYEISDDDAIRKELIFD